MVNSHTIIGHVGRDAELRQAGTQEVCQFSVATSEVWKDGNGVEQKAVHWHEVAIWGGLAKPASDMCKKGALVLVQGKVVTKEYEKDGVKHKRTQTVVSGFDTKFKLLRGVAEEKPAQAAQSSPTPEPDADDLPF